MRESERRTRHTPFDRAFPRAAGLTNAAPIGGCTAVHVLIELCCDAPVIVLLAGMPCLPDEPR